MRALHDKEIELAASQAAEYTRTSGLHQQEIALMRDRHLAEVKALRTELGVSDDVSDQDAAGDVGGKFSLSSLLPLLPMLMRFFRRPAEPTPTDVPNPFTGVVPTPPVDAPPGVPVDLATGQPVVIPPPTSPPSAPAAAPRAPLPGTGTHEGCTLDAPCAKHGGAAAAIPSVPRGVPPTAAAPPPGVPAEPAHYDGRPLADKAVSCTIFKPCKECVDRSRRPTATVAGSTSVLSRSGA